MPDKDDDVVNVNLEPEEALRLLLDTDLRGQADEEPAEQKDHKSGEPVIDSRGSP